MEGNYWFLLDLRIYTQIYPKDLFLYSFLMLELSLPDFFCRSTTVRLWFLRITAVLSTTFYWLITTSWHAYSFKLIVIYIHMYHFSQWEIIFSSVVSRIEMKTSQINLDYLFFTEVWTPWPQEIHPCLLNHYTTKQLLVLVTTNCYSYSYQIFQIFSKRIWAI